MKQLILDASPLIALFYEKDSYHQSAIKGFTQLHQQKTQLITPIPIITIVTVREIIEEQKRLDIKLVLEVLKSAEKQQEIKSNQMALNL